MRDQHIYICEEGFQDLLTSLEEEGVGRRARAAFELGCTGDLRAVPALIDALNRRDDEQVVANVAEALGRLGDVRGVPALAAALCKEFPNGGDLPQGRDREHPYQEIADALGEIRDPKAVAALTDAIKYCVRRRGGRDIHYLWNAVVALGEIRDVRGVPALVEALKSDATTNTRAAVRRALGRIGKRDAVLRKIRTLDPPSRVLVLNSLSSLSSEGKEFQAYCTPDAQRYCDEMTGDADPAVREAAHEVRRYLEQESARAAEEALRASAAREAAAEARFTEALARLTDSSGVVRTEAARCMGWLKDLRAVEPLIKALGDSDEFVRAAAASALAKLADLRAVEPLIRALGDREGSVRREAAQALGALSDLRALEPLIRALGDREWLVREYTIKALGKIGDPRALAPLIKALNNYSRSCDERAKAAEALGDLGDVGAAEPLKRWVVGSTTLSYEARVISNAAESALSRIFQRLGTSHPLG